MPVLEMESLLHEIHLHGKGVHSGLDGAVRFRRREDSGAIRFFWPGWRKPLNADDLISLKRKSRRATLLEGSEGQLFRTPEHLLAACLFFADEPIDVL